MVLMIITALIILLVSLANVTSSTNVKDSMRNDFNNDMLREILQHMDKIERNNNIRFDKIESHMDRMQRHLDKMETNNNLRFDKIERHMDKMETYNNIRFDQLEAKVQTENKNLSVLMETIVEQQMVITAEIFTVSQTLPFCCCQYQSTTDPLTSETTTPRPVKSSLTNCADAMGESGLDGVYQINVTNFNIGPLDVYCMKKVANLLGEDIINGTWLIIQRRQDNTTDFYQNWDMYQRGFGDLKKNFWIGLDKLYVLTESTEQELWVQLEDRNGETAWAKYSHFAIGNEVEKYKLKTIGGYEGTAGDSLTSQKGFKWSTHDKDNDNDIYVGNCAASSRKGAWWFSDCGLSSLNGIYGNNSIYKGILWKTFRGFEHSMKYAHMAIRPRT